MLGERSKDTPEVFKTIISSACLIIILSFPAAVPSSHAGDIPSEEIFEITAEELSSKLNAASGESYYGGKMIGGGGVVRGTIVIMNGALDIQDGGVLIGEAWIVNGKLILTGSARITGRVFLVNSDEYISRRASVDSGLVRYSCGCALDYERFEKDSSLVFLKVEDPSAVSTDFSFRVGTPCRVDYDIIDVGLKRGNPENKIPHTEYKAYLSIPLWKKSGGFFGFDAELSHPLIADRIDLISRLYKRTETNDDWQLSRLENGACVILSGDDFADYYESTGGEAGIRIKAFESAVVDMTVSLQKDKSMEARSVPSLFLEREKYRDNPPIDEGKRMAAGINIKIDTRDEIGWTYGGWKLNALLEKGISDGPGEFSYSFFDIELCRYSEISGGVMLDMRGKLFSTFTQIPAQLTRSLNGYSGIRGLSDSPFESRRGNRLALFSAELRKRVPDIPFIDKVITDASALLFSDIGILSDEDGDGPVLKFMDGKRGGWKKTAGIGLSGKSFFPYFGLYIAEDLDSDSFTPRYIIRFERSF